MRNYFLLFVIVLTSYSNYAQENKIDINKKQFTVGPKEFNGTIGLTFNLEKELDLNIVILNDELEILLKYDYDKIKSSSFKIDLHELKSGNYNLKVLSDGITLFEEKIIKF